MPNQLDSIITDLLNSFNHDKVVLFAGQDAFKNGELTSTVCRLPWSCIITTSTEDDFGECFQTDDDRDIRGYSPFTEMPVNLFDRSKLPIIHLYGKKGDYNAELEQISVELRPAYLKQKTETELNRIMSQMDIRSRFVVIGYNPYNTSELPQDIFILSWQKTQGTPFIFFNTIPSPSKLLYEETVRNGFTWYNGKLAESIEKVGPEYDFRFSSPAEDKHVFYKGKKPVTIKKSVLLRCRAFLQLLTEEALQEIKPIGKSLQTKWFYNFLNNSSDAPQWYGFSPQTSFYLKRNFEDKLVSTVKYLLNGKKIKKNGQNTAVILEGDPGSSKSVELAALAYKIFRNKKNPVIFLNSTNFYNTTQSEEVKVLDELMQEVEAAEGEDVRILIVWDSSAYRNVITEAKQLIHELENRGRRFVLVCSAYRNNMSPEEETKKEFFKISKKHELTKVKDNGEFYLWRDCAFVNAERDLLESEVIALKSKIELYTEIERNQIDSVFAELSDEKNIFQYFYRLILLLRPKLELGLSREQLMVDKYVRKQIAFTVKTEVVINPIREAFRKAGITLNQKIEDELENEIESNNIYDLDRFNLCIAIFSRFKLDTPYSVALRMLCKDSKDYYGKNSVYNNSDLFHVLTTRINYIHYIEKTDAQSVFRFRNALEASIFLSNNHISIQQQVQILEDLINYYIEYFNKTNEVDDALKDSIQAILKMYGPNSSYQEFLVDGKAYNEHIIILQKLDTIADLLFKAREIFHIPDPDCRFALLEVTLIREIYGNMWDKIHKNNIIFSTGEELWNNCEGYTVEDYNLRLTKLSKALDLAQESRLKLDDTRSSFYNYRNQRNNYQATLNHLTVEIALCNNNIENIKQEYISSYNNASIDFNKTVSAPGYDFVYEILFKAISVSPLNGYLYNALFSSFEIEYKNASAERKLYLLSGIRMLAEEASTLEISNRGPNNYDELSEHLNRIAQCASGDTVRISDIENHKTTPFQKLFDIMLGRNNAAGICYVCQRELDLAKLDGLSIAKYENENGEEYVLSPQQLDTCKRIVTFLKRPEYNECIDRSPYALYMLIRVQWMLYNQRPLSIGHERQKTYLNIKEWNEIKSVCEKYEAIGNDKARPNVTLLLALAKIIIQKDYAGAANLMHKWTVMQYHRMRVPYLLCSTAGIADKFSGYTDILPNHSNKGYIKVNGFPPTLNQRVSFYLPNLGLRRMPENHRLLKEFELGLSLTGIYSAYKQIQAKDGGEVRE